MPMVVTRNTGSNACTSSEDRSMNRLTKPRAHTVRGMLTCLSEIRLAVIGVERAVFRHGPKPDCLNSAAYRAAPSQVTHASFMLSIQVLAESNGGSNHEKSGFLAAARVCGGRYSRHPP